MKRTGIFFHYQNGERLRDFPALLDGILDKDNVYLYDAYYPGKTPSSYELDPVPIGLLTRVHDRRMIDTISRSSDYKGALYSAAGTVAAAARIWRDEIDNAFVFTGYGDHHAGTSFYGGGCYFNGAALAISELRQEFGARKLAIADTDAHHGDGTWQIFQDDPDTLYVCFCGGESYSRNNNINVHVPWRTTDNQYLELVQLNLRQHLEVFRPEALFWNWGYDGTTGDYGDIGISPDTHVRLAEVFRQAADDFCESRLIVVLCGGSRRDLASRLIPCVLRVLIGG